MPFLGALLSGLGVFARVALGSIVLKIFLVLGVGLASAGALSPLINALIGEAESAWNAVPQPFADWLAMTQADVAITIIGSAALIRGSFGGLRLVSRATG